VAKYMKFIVAALGAGAYTVQAAISDGNITGTEGVGVLTAAVIAVLVLLVPNKPSAEGVQARSGPAPY
jgi:hypothetical protein